ncbi:MAG: TIGR04141 family sporadically distributed protein [Alphaproteobacteria bacterium]|nr:TIGR04141 family sporadically distributed protein [Alphaproteobacteria bacterium]
MLFFKYLFVSLCVLTFHVNAADLIEDAREGSSTALSLRVYHFSTDDIDPALKETVKKEPIVYTYRLCQKNPSCRWISRPKTKTAPHFWSLVAEGTGIRLDETEDDLNTGEHWLYDIPADVTESHQHFAVIFGLGEFFKPKHDSIDVDFGKRIVSNLVEEPEGDQEKGPIRGRPYNKFTSEVGGWDYCSVHLRRPSLADLIALCDTLYRYSQFSSRATYDQVKIKATELGKDLIPIPDADFAVIAAKEEEEEENLDGDEVTYEVDGHKKIAVRVFGKYLTFEGLEEYIHQTKIAVQAIVDIEAAHTLPPFNKGTLQTVEVAADEDKGETEEVDEEEETKPNKTKRTDWEGRYNKWTAENNDGYLLLDKKCVENVEVCDLWIPGRRELVHVKIGTDSHNLNHLFGQGYASADLLTRIGYSRRILFNLLRRDVALRAQLILAREFEAAHAELWGRFVAWRETNKARLETKYGTKRAQTINQLLVHIEEEGAALGSIQTRLDALRGELDEAHQAQIDTLKETVSTRVNKKEIKEFLKGLQPKASGVVLLTLEDFPRGKKPFKGFLDELRGLRRAAPAKGHAQGRRKRSRGEITSPKPDAEDAELTALLTDLEQYRADLLEGHLIRCWDEVEKEFNAGDITIDGVLEKLQEKYTAKLSKGRIAKTKFSADHLKTLCGEKSLRQLGDGILAGFVTANDTPFTVVYAVITDKSQEDLELLPLGARINLLRTVEDLKKRKKGEVPLFNVMLRVIPNETPDKKTKQKKPAEGKKAKGKTGVVSRSKGSRPKETAANAPPLPPVVIDLEHPQSVAKGESLRPYAQITVNYGEAGKPDGLQDTYVTCPTIGDGNCFFHAILTEPGEDKDTVTVRAAIIRDALPDTVLGNEEYKLAVKRELLARCGSLYLLDPEKVPETIRQKLIANDTYVKFRQSILTMHFAAGTTFDAIQQNPREPFDEASILEDINEDMISGYLEDYKSANVGLSKAYIEIPTFRDDMACLGYVIAKDERVKVHIFLYNQTSGTLEYKGIIGDPDGTTIRYVLQYGIHYWALYHDSFSEAEKARLKQIESNQTGKVFVRESSIVAALTHAAAVPAQTGAASWRGATDPSQFAMGDIRRFLKHKKAPST